MTILTRKSLNDDIVASWSCLLHDVEKSFFFGVGTGVTVNCLHPGVIQTDLGRHAQEGSHLSWFMRISFKIFTSAFRWMMITPEKGAQTSIYCAIAPELDEVSGKFFA